MRVVGDELEPQKKTDEGAVFRSIPNLLNSFRGLTHKSLNLDTDKLVNALRTVLGEPKKHNGRLGHWYKTRTDAANDVEAPF